MRSLQENLMSMKDQEYGHPTYCIIVDKMLVQIYGNYYMNNEHAWWWENFMWHFIRVKCCQCMSSSNGMAILNKEQDTYCFALQYKLTVKLSLAHYSYLFIVVFIGFSPNFLTSFSAMWCVVTANQFAFLTTSIIVG